MPARMHRGCVAHFAVSRAPKQPFLPSLACCSSLSGSVTFLDMLIIGHTPVFAPCLVVSMPWSWTIGLIAFLQIWISLLHCVGSRTDKVPNFGGIMVHPHDHAAHHKYGRENVNYGILLSFWDRVMGTYQVQDPNNFFYIGNHSERQPQQPLLHNADGKLNTLRNSKAKAA